MQDFCVVCGADVSDMGTHICKKCLSECSVCEKCINFMPYHCITEDRPHSNGFCIKDYKNRHFADTCEQFEEWDY